MKKFRLFITLALVFVLALPLFAGCDLADLFGNGQNNSSANKNLFAIDVVGNIKTEYVLNESFDANGAKLKLIYDDNSSIELSLDKTMTNFDSTTVGKKDLTVTYQDKTKVLEYRVDAFKFGVYRQKVEYIGSSGLPVETLNYDSVKIAYAFNKNGTGNTWCGEEGQAGYQNQEFTWEYVDNGSIIINLNDGLGQQVNLVIDSVQQLHREVNTPGTAPHGSAYVRSRYTLNFFA